MQKLNFQEALDQIIEEDPRYDEEAYVFTREALDFTIKMLGKPQEGDKRHVSGQELLQGIQKYALQEFGAMARTVLKRWGVKSSEDFGEIVFNLVDKGVLGKTEKDRRADFASAYDFVSVFDTPFLPKKKTAKKKKRTSKTTKKPGI